MRTVRQFTEPRADPVHVVLASPITLPTGTTPQNLVTVDLTSHIAQRLADYTAAGAWIVPSSFNPLATTWLALVFFHFSRPSNSGSVTLYYSLPGGNASMAAGGSNLSISTFHRTTVSDTTASVTLQASQSPAADWTLSAYTIVCIPAAVSLIGSSSQAVTGGGTISVSDNIYTTPIAAIGNYTDASDLIIVPSGVNVSSTFNRHNYAAVIIQSLTATSPATTTSSQHGVNLSQAAGRDLLYTGVHYVAQDVVQSTVIGVSSTTANVRTIRQLYRITDCNVYVLR